MLRRNVTDDKQSRFGVWPDFHARLTVVDPFPTESMQFIRTAHRVEAQHWLETTGTRNECIGCGLVEKGQVKDQVKCQDRK